MSAATVKQNPFQKLEDQWNGNIQIFDVQKGIVEDTPFYQALNKVSKRIPELIDELNKEYKEIKGKSGIKEDQKITKKTQNYSVEVSFINEFIKTIKTICKEHEEALKNAPKEEEINEYTGYEGLYQKRLEVMHNQLINGNSALFTKGTVQNVLNYYLNMYERNGKELGWKKYIWYGLVGAPDPTPYKT